jgi:hypothetical protein
MRMWKAVGMAAFLFLTSACQQATVRGPEGKKLTVTVPASVTIRRGETVSVDVGINREDFSQPITASISKLPSGVGADESSQKVERNTTAFVLKASKTADLVDGQAVEITVEGPDGMTASQHFKLNVTE